MTGERRAYYDRPGRPPQIEVGWTPQLEDAPWEATSPVGKILTSIKFGNFINTSAAAAGLSPRTVFIWLARGREHDPQGDDLSGIPEGHLAYVQFLRAVERAEAEAEQSLVLTVRQGAKDDPKLALQMLGRRFKKNWREDKGVDLTVASEERQDAVAKAVAGDPNLALKAQEFALAAGAVVPDDDDDEG